MVNKSAPLAFETKIPGFRVLVLFDARLPLPHRGKNQARMGSHKLRQRSFRGTNQQLSLKDFGDQVFPNIRRESLRAAPRVNVQS
jgi:hypothetical protein